MTSAGSHSVHFWLKGVSLMALAVCSMLVPHAEVALAQKSSGSGGGSWRGIFSPPRAKAGTAGGSSSLGFILSHDTVIAIEEGVSPGMSYAVLKMPRNNHFAYFCVLIHKYSEGKDDIRYEVRVQDGRGDISQSYRIGTLKFPLAYSIVVKRQAKAYEETEMMKIQGADVDLNQGRLLVLDMTGDALVIKQAAMPQFDMPKEDLDEAAEQILTEVGKSLKDGTLKTRLINSVK
jgi:hypothetical protein